MERRFKTARLLAFTTADGFFRVKTDKATIGKEYRVDVNSIRNAKYLHKPTGELFWCEVVDAEQDGVPGLQPFPTELLEIEK